ncbi:MAG: helix-turn-helix transcriptional regulator [Clostridiales bacterium]|nr:helix-turn-helix transcriptional regulator [Clostridiales bacterium]
MLLRELRDILQNLKKTKITNEFLGNLYGTSSQNISKRISNNSEATIKEAEIAQQALNVNIIFKANDPKNKVIKNSLIKQNDTTLLKRYENIGKRLDLIQDKNNIADSKMAKLLRISEEEFLEIKCGEMEIDTEILFKIKQNFEVSIDWLLWG